MLPTPTLLAGCAPAVVRELLTLGPQAAGLDARVLTDVCRWQQMHGQAMAAKPGLGSVLGTALLCPITTSTFRHGQPQAMRLRPPQTQWRLLRHLGGDEDWPACVSMFKVWWNASVGGVAALLVRRSGMFSRACL